MYTVVRRFLSLFCSIEKGRGYKERSENHFASFSSFLPLFVGGVGGREAFSVCFSFFHFRLSRGEEEGEFLVMLVGPLFLGAEVGGEEERRRKGGILL